jgi:hypothetical protein
MKNAVTSSKLSPQRQALLVLICTYVSRLRRPSDQLFLVLACARSPLVIVQ